jgi:hypothetical protein
MNREERRARGLGATAHHEAGHAVACIVLGRAFVRVTIMPEGDSLGHIRKTPPPKSLQPDIETGPRERRWIEREALIALAGPAAEARFLGRRDRQGARGDVDRAVGLAEYLYPPGKVLDKYLDFMSERAASFVATPANWTRIEALAGSLVVRRTLSGREAREICRLALCKASGVPPPTRP